MAKLWEKDLPLNKKIESFTIGKDKELDLFLAKYDVLGSIAHARMLNAVGLLTAEETKLLIAELKKIYCSIENGEFKIEEGVEDVQTAGRSIRTTCITLCEVAVKEAILRHGSHD